jgi:hypothetical protein
MYESTKIKMLKIFAKQRGQMSTSMLWEKLNETSEELIKNNAIGVEIHKMIKEGKLKNEGRIACTHCCKESTMYSITEEGLMYLSWHS